MKEGDWRQVGIALPEAPTSTDKYNKFSKKKQDLNEENEKKLTIRKNR